MQNIDSQFPATMPFNIVSCRFYLAPSLVLTHPCFVPSVPLEVSFGSDFVSFTTLGPSWGQPAPFATKTKGFGPSLGPVLSIHAPNSGIKTNRSQMFKETIQKLLIKKYLNFTLKKTIYKSKKNNKIHFFVHFLIQTHR